jgi:murein DD-endopeptidase MepM/ murein hydrolase activator NlpD
MIKQFISGLTLAMFTVPVNAAPQLSLQPAEVVQGKYTVLKISTGQDEQFLKNTYVKFNGKNIPLAQVDAHSYRAVIGIAANLKPGNYPIEVDNQDNENIIKTRLTVKKGKFSSQSITFYKPKLTKAQQEKIKQEDQLVENTKMIFSEKQLWDSPFMLPVPHRVISLYGVYRYLNGKFNDYHTGVDFASPYGAPIKAINNGKVSLARYFSKWNDNGNIIFLDHGQGISSAYLHLSKIAVKEGDFVKKGQTIAYVGNTGRSTGPHLHWGVYLNGQNTDGLFWVKNSNNFLQDNR